EDVAKLVKLHSFEEVASLIWIGSIEKKNELFFSSDIKRDSYKLESDSLQCIQKFLLYLESKSTQAYDLRTLSIEILGSNIIRTIIAVITRNFSSLEVSRKLSLHYCPSNLVDIANELINTALIIIADHELNSSSFTARNVASAGSTLFQVIIAGLSALQGFRHGGSLFRVEAMVNELLVDFNFEKNLKMRLKRGDKIFGFGHNLYPEGDIRAKILLSGIKVHFGNSIKFETLMKINSICSQASGNKPNIDFVLFMLSSVLELPVDFAQLLFALGRISGWIGHALEEYEENRLLRPRAKYIGKKPH
ncbi:MAG: citrate synthase, partial [Candidatus Hodarchaeales archaeon]